MSETALITGVSGQDGYYLAKHLLELGIIVVGTTRNIADARLQLGEDLGRRIQFTEWDLRDREQFAELLSKYRPSQIYNLAALSSGEFMDKNPEIVTDVNGVAVLRILECIKDAGFPLRFCQASSSEVFAGSTISPQEETTPRVPRSVYGAAKIFADNTIRLYRQKYDLFACSAILFNHESPRRGVGFVTRKVVQSAVKIKLGSTEKLKMGNLAATRDWGFAGDYVRAMKMMLDASVPQDYVIATGKTHSVADLCEIAFSHLGLDYRDHVQIAENHFRDAEALDIVGNCKLANQDLGWQAGTSFRELIAMMVDQELLSFSAPLG
jgi:GDPmannose 4,6-dehydratase